MKNSLEKIIWSKLGNLFTKLERSIEKSFSILQKEDTHALNCISAQEKYRKKKNRLQQMDIKRVTKRDCGCVLSSPD